MRLIRELREEIDRLKSMLLSFELVRSLFLYRRSIVLTLAGIRPAGFTLLLL